MIYVELGVKPILIDIKIRVISFWSRLLTETENKRSSLMYKIVYQMHKNKQIKSEYINNVENIINTCGFSGIWESQSLSISKWFKLAISQKLHDQYLQEWSSVVDISSYGNRLLKETFGYSSYFSILPSYYSKSLISFRTRNHKLLIEIGRWNGVPFN